MVLVCSLSVILFLIGSAEAKGDALQYVNYTSYKYKIQFQYPTNWQQTEKIDNKDKGVDIAVTKNSNTSMATFWIILGNGTKLGSDLQAGIKNLNESLMNIYKTNAYETIEPPAIITINGQLTATFINSLAYKEDDIVFAFFEQTWLVYVGSKDYYLIGFKAPVSSFNDPENLQVRNQFIKSMKFLGRP